MIAISWLILDLQAELSHNYPTNQCLSNTVLSLYNPGGTSTALPGHAERSAEIRLSVSWWTHQLFELVILECVQVSAEQSAGQLKVE